MCIRCETINFTSHKKGSCDEELGKSVNTLDLGQDNKSYTPIDQKYQRI